MEHVVTDPSPAWVWDPWPSEECLEGPAKGIRVSDQFPADVSTENPATIASTDWIFVGTVLAMQE